MATTEGWVVVMLNGVDATSVDQHPVENWNEAWALFFVAFIVFGSFFMINLFVGGVLDNYDRIAQEAGGSAFMSETQKAWVKTHKTMSKVKLKPRFQASWMLLPEGVLQNCHVETF